MCIPARHGNCLVPHKFLNPSQGHTRHGKAAGEGMPETMPSEIEGSGLATGGVKPFSRGLERVPGHKAVARLCQYHYRPRAISALAKGEQGFQRVCAHFNEEVARAAFLPVIEGAVSDFQGYDPAVKTLTKMYRLWLDQVANGPAHSTPASLSAAGAMQNAARLAKGSIRRTKALGKRVLAALGMRTAGLLSRAFARYDSQHTPPSSYQQLRDGSANALRGVP